MNVVSASEDDTAVSVPIVRVLHCTIVGWSVAERVDRASRCRT